MTSARRCRAVVVCRRAAAPGEERVGDDGYMRRAIELAGRGCGSVAPNPLVGAVVVDRRGTIVGEGYHAAAGSPHAETEALAEAGDRARGATLYVNLEPCNHHGRTPPCTEAIVAAGVERVVVAMRDPNPIVDGGGIAALGAAGITVTLGVLGAEAGRLNAPFARHVTTGMPFVTWKCAASLDGKVAAGDGSSRWITGPAARADAHRLRAWSDAILVGSGTVLADDPHLTVRDAEAPSTPPLRVVVDARGRVPATARVLDDAAPTLIATSADVAPATRDAWRAAGAEVLTLPAEGGTLALRDLFAVLGKRDVQQVLLEGGPTLAWSAVSADLVDRVVWYLAPSLVGGERAPGALGGAGFSPIDVATRLHLVSVEPVGDDLRLEADVHGHR